MRQSQQARLSALRQIQRYLIEYSADFPVVNATRARADFDELLAKLDQLGADQVRFTDQAAGFTAEKHRLRTVLRLHHMKPISLIAKLELGESAIAAKLTVPYRDVTDSDLLGHATQMASFVADVREKYVGTLPDDFDQRLLQAAEDLRVAIEKRDNLKAFAMKATETIDDELTRATGIVRILDALVSAEAHDNRALLVGWKAAKHVRAKPGVPRGTVRAA